MLRDSALSLQPRLGRRTSASDDSDEIAPQSMARKSHGEKSKHCSWDEDRRNACPDRQDEYHHVTRVVMSDDRCGI
jgi:hypothetical protein